MRAYPENMGRIAADTGINYISISKMVNGRMPISPKHAFIFANYFGVKPEDVYGMTDE